MQTNLNAGYLPALSNRYLYNISKKELGKDFIILHADKHQSFYKLALSFLVEVARHVQSTQIRKLVIFLQYIKKNVSQLPLYPIAMQNIQIFCGCPVMFAVICFWLVLIKTELILCMLVQIYYWVGYAQKWAFMN